jgi:hypothetical protein
VTFSAHTNDYLLGGGPCIDPHQRLAYRADTLASLVPAPPSRGQIVIATAICRRNPLWSASGIVAFLRQADLREACLAGRPTRGVIVGRFAAVCVRTRLIPPTPAQPHQRHVSQCNLD